MQCQGNKENSRFYLSFTVCSEILKFALISLNCEITWQNCTKIIFQLCYFFNIFLKKVLNFICAWLKLIRVNMSNVNHLVKYPFETQNYPQFHKSPENCAVIHSLILEIYFKTLRKQVLDISTKQLSPSYLPSPKVK